MIFNVGFGHLRKVVVFGSRDHLFLAPNYHMTELQASTGRHCHSTLPLTVTGCRCLGIFTGILLSLLSFSAGMTVSPSAAAGGGGDRAAEEAPVDGGAAMGGGVVPGRRRLAYVNW